jgi:DNA-binding transcriptional regulator YdaS (Cro superfamily)
MDLKTYIRKNGIEECAKLFNSTPRAVSGWMYGERTPRIKQANIIASATRGEVSLYDIYKLNND